MQWFVISFLLIVISIILIPLSLGEMSTPTPRFLKLFLELIKFIEISEIIGLIIDWEYDLNFSYFTKTNS